MGSLLYLSVCTRPDIAQAVGALSRYMAAPTTTHWQAARSVLAYLAGTVIAGITYIRSAPSTLIGYTDADYGGELDSRRSTTGYVFVLASGAISSAPPSDTTMPHPRGMHLGWFFCFFCCCAHLNEEGFAELLSCVGCVRARYMRPPRVSKHHLVVNQLRSTWGMSG